MRAAIAKLIRRRPSTKKGSKLNCSWKKRHKGTKKRGSNHKRKHKPPYYLELDDGAGMRTITRSSVRRRIGGEKGWKINGEADWGSLTGAEERRGKGEKGRRGKEEGEGEKREGEVMATIRISRTGGEIYATSNMNMETGSDSDRDGVQRATGQRTEGSGQRG